MVYVVKTQKIMRHFSKPYKIQINGKYHALGEKFQYYNNFNSLKHSICLM